MLHQDSRRRHRQQRRCRPSLNSEVKANTDAAVWLLVVIFVGARTSRRAFAAAGRQTMSPGAGVLAGVEVAVAAHGTREAVTSNAAFRRFAGAPLDAIRNGVGGAYGGIDHRRCCTRVRAGFVMFASARNGGQRQRHHEEQWLECFASGEHCSLHGHPFLRATMMPRRSQAACQRGRLEAAVQNVHDVACSATPAADEIRRRERVRSLPAARALLAPDRPGVRRRGWGWLSPPLLAAAPLRGQGDR